MEWASKQGGESIASLPTRRAMAQLAADNLIAALGAGPQAGAPPTALNPQVLARR